MSDQFIIDLAPGWALGSDPSQWVIMTIDKPPSGAVLSMARARLRASAFIASTKAVLCRVIHENEIELTPKATDYIEAIPDTFREWYRWHKRWGGSVPEREAA